MLGIPWENGVRRAKHSEQWVAIKCHQNEKMALFSAHLLAHLAESSLIEFNWNPFDTISFSRVFGFVAHLSVKLTSSRFLHAARARTGIRDISARMEFADARSEIIFRARALVYRRDLSLHLNQGPPRGKVKAQAWRWWWADRFGEIFRQSATCTAKLPNILINFISWSRHPDRKGCRWQCYVT